MNAHVRRRHPDVDVPKGSTRNLTPNPIITQNEESYSCKYYNFVSFPINKWDKYRKSRRKYKFIEEYR